MRAPKRKRPPIRKISIPAGLDPEKIVGRVRYVGSPEHKDVPSFAGQPRPRADASICDRRFLEMQAELTGWLRDAVRLGAISLYAEGGFPRYIWYKDGEIVYEARLVNRVSGEYKGYALQKEEWPQGIRDIYE